MHIYTYVIVYTYILIYIYIYIYIIIKLLFKYNKEIINNSYP